MNMTFRKLARLQVLGFLWAASGSHLWTSSSAPASTALGMTLTWRTRNYTTHILIGLVLLLVLIGPAQAANDDTVTTELFLTQHQAGLRLGVWSNQGDLPPEAGELTSGDAAITTGSFKTNINSASAYVEAFFGYRLAPWLVGELSLGTVNRGSVTLLDDSTGASDIGNLMIYPILVQFRLYAPRIPSTSLYPYLMAGGGLHYGRRNVQFSNSQVYYANWQEETATDFNYVVGGGVDWPIAASIGLDFTVKYMPINMSLVVIDKWDALAFTIGVKYLYLPK